MIDSGMWPARFASDNPQDELFARIRASVASTPASTVGTRTRIFVALAVAASLTAAAILITSHAVYRQYAPPGLAVLVPSPAHLLVVLVLLVVQTCMATVLATWRGLRGFGSGVMSLYLASALVAPVYAALVMISPVHADDPTPLGVTVSQLGYRCLALSAVVGVVVLASFAAALRRSVPVASVPRSAAIGAAAGAWAGLSVFIFCPSGDPQHMFFGHVLPIVAFTLLGVATLPRILRL
jgi:hypothetical protein